MTGPLRAPFPWFGGKSRVAHLVWAAFGDVQNYVEPFAGSLAVLLGRPTAPRIETVNDLDCYVANFWRAVHLAPEEVAYWADWPVNEIDLHARHRWLVDQAEFREKMRGDPEYFDARVAGWWVWGICQWIGGGWCAESNWNPGVVRSRGNRTADEKRRPDLHTSAGVHKLSLEQTANWKKRPSSLGKGGRGVGRTTADRSSPPDLHGSRGAAGRGVHASGRTADWNVHPSLRGSRGAAGDGIHASGLPKKMPFLSAGSGDGVGVHSKGATAPRGRLTANEERRPELKVSHGVHSKMVKMDRGTTSRMQGPVVEWMHALAERLRRVRVCCGDWTRVLGPSATVHIGVTGVFLDPPYLADFRDPSLYGTESADVAHAVREWAIEHGRNPKMRIALCGYEGEHQMPKDWQCVAWKASGGYAAAAGNKENSAKERIWFSPACARARAQLELLGDAS